MANKFIDVQDAAVRELLTQLARRVEDASPLLHALGEDGAERAKARFDTGTAPDGTAWAPNSAVTIAAYIRNRGGKQKGKKGQAVPNKKPLIGESQTLKQIHYQVDDNSVMIGSSRRWAFMLNFGGTKTSFPHLWGDIPARPFFPMQADGTLYPSELNAITEEIRRYLTL